MTTLAHRPVIDPVIDPVIEPDIELDTGCRAATLRTHDEAVAAAHELAALVAERAAERDRDRKLPYAEVEALKRSGLLGIAVPTSYGGPGLPPSSVAEIFAIIAAADSNVAQIHHSHFVYLNLVRLAANDEQRRAVFDLVLSGGLLANAQSERGGRDITDIATTLAPDGRGGLVLEGTKYYCTGTMFADLVPVLARTADPEGVTGFGAGDHIVLVPATTPGLSISDDWDAVGQRTTASGTVTLDHVLVRPEWVVPRAAAFDSPNGYGAYAQLLHTAIEVGLTRGALAAAVDFVTTPARPWFEAEVERAADDPFVVQRFGELSVATTTAGAVLAHAGRAVDTVFAEPSVEHAGSASLAVATAKVVAERSALEVSSALFEVSGTRASGAGARLDRFWRNARTHTLHDPVRWKLQHLGRHALAGVLPPSHGTI